MAMNIGFIGVGTLAAAMIEGLSRQDAAPRIHISKRSESRSAALEAKFPHVACEPLNQAVVDKADILFLGVRPSQVPELLDGLRFPHGKRVVSLAARTPLAKLRMLLGPDVPVTRLLLLPSAGAGRSPICIYPPDPALAEMLRGLGENVKVETEADLDTLTGLGGLMSTYVQLQEVAVSYVMAKGVAEAAAHAFVSQMVCGLGATAAIGDPRGRHNMVRQHETQGGINERCRGHLEQAGWFGHFVDALKVIDGHSLMEGKEYQPG